MSARSNILNKLRAGLAGTTPRPDDFDEGLVTRPWQYAPEDRITRLRSLMEAVHTEIHQLTTEEWPSKVQELLESRGLKNVLYAPGTGHGKQLAEHWQRAEPRPELLVYDRPIEEWSQLELLDGEYEILPGLEVMVTNGPTRGHQIVLMNHGGEKIAFMGDLVPTAHHLDLASIPSFDQFPEETLEMKRELLGRAEKEGWLLIFSHSLDRKAGYLESYNGGTYLRPVDL